MSKLTIWTLIYPFSEMPQMASFYRTMMCLNLNNCLYYESQYDYDRSSHYGGYGNTYNCSMPCIPIEKKCDGVLDFFKMPPANDNSKAAPDDQCNRNPYAEYLFLDEFWCAEKWIGIYGTLFIAAGIGILTCIAIWILSWPTLVFYFTLIRNVIRQYCCSQIPMGTFN